MKLWPMKVCQNPCQNQNAHAHMEFLVISILNIFKALFSMTTQSVSFYSLSHVLSDSVIDFIQVQYQNLTCFVITVKNIHKKLFSCY